MLLPLLALSTGLAQSPVDGRWALIIGVDDYTDPDILDLRFAARDAHEVASTLIESGAYPTDHVVVMTPEQTNPSLRPTRTHILEQIRLLGQRTGAEGLLVYFSGHGYRIEIDGRGQNVLLPMDTSLRVPAHTAIPIDEVLAQLAQSGVPQRLAIFDACRDDLAQSRSLGGSGWVLPPYQGEGTSALYCTRDGEVSYELESEQLGACTATLVRGLRGAADEGRDGVIGARELYLYLDTQLQALDLPTPQRPTLAGEVSGSDLAIAPVPAPPEGAPAVCPSDPHTVKSVLRGALDLCAADETAFLVAGRAARASALCLGEPATPELAYDLYRLEAQVSRRLQDDNTAVAWLRAAHEAMPQQDLRLGLDERCWMAELEAPALAAPPSRTSPVEIPRGVRYLQDGESTTLRVEDRPALVQVVNPDRTVQWTRQVLPGDRLPPVAVPTKVMTRRQHGGQMLWGALGGGLTAGALYGGGLLVVRSFERHPSCDALDDACIAELEALETRADGLGTAAAITLGVAGGVGAVGLVLSR